MDKEKPVRKGHSLRTGFLLSAGFVPLRLPLPGKTLSLIFLSLEGKGLR
jgi:hypothetical protein